MPESYTHFLPIPHDPQSSKTFSEVTLELTKKAVETRSPFYTGRFRDAASNLATAAKPQVLPPKFLPCANVHPSRYFACAKRGTRACGNCRMVSYCSQECQSEHWKAHKDTCKMHKGSSQWKPAWTLEGRLPEFLRQTTDRTRMEHRTICSLWGNMPPIDVINLKENENDLEKRFTIALLQASADPKNLVKTIASLPADYSGRLTVLVNDPNAMTTSRTALMLLALGTLPDLDIAVDIALHFWYSTFFPAEYHLQLLSCILPLLIHIKDHPEAPYSLGENSEVYATFAADALSECFSFYVTSNALGVDEAQAEYERIRNLHSKRDFRDRIYAGLTPSHRKAFAIYRQYGLVLPVGAPNAHFNHPNASLFTSDGKWLQGDSVDPLDGWNLEDVIARGKAHGAQAEDIYGCLYFFLSEQLRDFAERLRKLPISLTFTSVDACELSTVIKSNRLSPAGLPSTARFDRIDVSNLFDSNNLGLDHVLTAWAPLLADSPHATLFGHFANWVAEHKDGRSGGVDLGTQEELVRKLTTKLHGIAKSPLDAEMSSFSAALQDLEVMYESSGPFRSFLEKKGLQGIVKKMNVRLKEDHTVVPHRILSPLHAPASALPDLKTDDMWYNYTKLTSVNWCKRFVEFGRATA